MAFINGEMDVCDNISIETYSSIASAVSDICTWTESYPYGAAQTWTNGIMFNCAKEPLDNVNVRWALALSFDIDSVLISASNGKRIATAIPVCYKFYT